jgi:hypothetical protein
VTLTRLPQVREAAVGGAVPGEVVRDHDDPVQGAAACSRTSSVPGLSERRWWPDWLASYTLRSWRAIPRAYRDLATSAGTVSGLRAPESARSGAAFSGSAPGVFQWEQHSPFGD